jgi:hypothetical protein
LPLAEKLSGRQGGVECTPGLKTMADPLHSSLTEFRDTILTAVARLEFQMRDMRSAQLSSQAPMRPGPSTSNYPYYNSTWTPPGEISAIRSDPCAELVSALNEMSRRVEHLEMRLSATILQTSNNIPAAVAHDVDTLLEIEPPTNSRNVLVPSMRNTPALTAAAAAACPPMIHLGEEDNTSDDEAPVKSVIVSEEEEEEDDENPLKPIKINGKPYFVDSDNVVYVETDEGYEEIGMYNPSTKTLTLHDAASSESEGESVVEVEDFIYKSKTYQRDGDNNVYYDGELVGTWNGKKIVASA